MVNDETDRDASTPQTSGGGGYNRPPDLSVHRSGPGTSSRAGLMVGVVAVVVLGLLAVAVTAFIIYLRSGDDPSGVVESFVAASPWPRPTAGL